MDISDILAQINALAAEAAAHQAAADCWNDLIAALPERCRSLKPDQIAGLIIYLGELVDLFGQAIVASQIAARQPTPAQPKRQRRKLTTQDEADIARCVGLGRHADEIADELGLARSVVCYQLRRPAADQPG